MHALRLLIEREVARLGWKQADLVKASGLKKQHISYLMNDARDRLPELPELATIEGLARAFGMSPAEVWQAAAKAAGVQVDEPIRVPDAQAVSDDELIRELVTRLRDCAPVIRPLDISTLNEAGPPQLIDLMNDLRAAATVSASQGLEFRAVGENHLADYLDALFARALAGHPTRDDSRSEPDPARPSDPRGHS